MALLYQSIDESPCSKLICIRQKGKVVGIIAGTYNMRDVYKRLLKRWWALGIALTPSLFSPNRIYGMIEILTLARRNRDNNKLNKLPPAELLSIVVAPAFRGRGYAEKLYYHLANFFITSDQDSFKIVVGSTLESAHRFYRRMGAQPFTEIEVHEGCNSVVYIQSTDKISVGTTAYNEGD